MQEKHIAFCLEQAYGHIIPTLGIASELLRRGHRVSYAVGQSFEAAICKIGARAMVLSPVETRTKLCNYTRRPDGSHNFDQEDIDLKVLMTDLEQRRTSNALEQLESLYRHDRPDVTIHDDTLDTAGRALALKWRIPKIMHMPSVMPSARINRFRDDQLILASVPRFFQENIEAFDDRFKFIGFIPEGRREVFAPWPHSQDRQRVIVISVTTGLLPQIDFCNKIIEAFGDSHSRIVLSIAGSLDRVSAISSTDISCLPDNIVLNTSSSNFDILQNACLFVGQGGQGSALEAIYCGVPVLLIPPTQFHDWVASRVAALGLGIRLSVSAASPVAIRQCAAQLLTDELILANVRKAQQLMHQDHGATLAADLIEGHLRAN